MKQAQCENSSLKLSRKSYDPYAPEKFDLQCPGPAFSFWQTLSPFLTCQGIGFHRQNRSQFHQDQLIGVSFIISVLI